MIRKDLLKGTLKPIILKLLSENDRMYGYEITLRVKELSAEKIQLSYGGLYPILHKLEANGEVLTETEIIDNRVRKYYYLTKKGKRTADKHIKELEEFVNTIRMILKPGTTHSICPV